MSNPKQNTRTKREKNIKLFPSLQNFLSFEEKETNTFYGKVHFNFAICDHINAYCGESNFVNLLRSKFILREFALEFNFDIKTSVFRLGIIFFRIVQSILILSQSF